ncbi:MAG: GNAT family N-acetyltransferase [Bacteroidota bacterium]
MEFVKCSIEQLSPLRTLALASYQDHYTHLWSDQGAHYLNTQYSRVALENALGDPNVEIYLIEEGQEKSGFVKIVLDSGIGSYSPQDTLELEKIYFLKKSTRKGIGKQSLHFVEKRALELKKSYIWLKSMAFGPVIAFYKKNGFQIIREEKLKSAYVLDQYRDMYVWIKKV